jgi:DNA-binding CsgD family transcriptional regulator
MLRLNDVRAVVRLGNELHELPPGPTGRKRHLLAGLCRLVDAPVGVGLLLRVQESDSQLIPISSVQWGWESARQRAAVARFLRSGQPADPAAGALLALLRQGAGSVTRTRQQLVPRHVWQSCQHVQEFKRSLGVDECIYSLLPLHESQLVAAITLHRPWGQNHRFTERDRVLVDLVHTEHAWIYKPDLPLSSPEAIRLSFRLRQTLQYLLSGDSEKQIAARTRLSRNTVHHYVKALYRHFQVSSRSELLARWVTPGDLLRRPGGQRHWRDARG